MIESLFADDANAAGHQAYEEACKAEGRTPTRTPASGRHEPLISNYHLDVPPSDLQGLREQATKSEACRL